MSPAQEQMALAAVAGALDQPLGPYALGAAHNPAIRISRRHALRVIRLAFYGVFSFGTAVNLIILSLLIDWQGVAESIGLGFLFQ
jgi:hypothetical protein